MARFTDAQLADFMLDARRNGMETAQRRYVKKQWHRWFGFGGMIVAVVGLGVVYDAPIFVAFAVDLAVGVLWSYRDGRKQSGGAWEFYARVIDWAKVEQFARGKNTDTSVT